MAVVYVYMSAGVGRLNVAYPSLGAMLLPRLFCFHNLIAYVNGQQGSAGQAPLCVPLLSAKI